MNTPVLKKITHRRTLSETYQIVLILQKYFAMKPVIYRFIFCRLMGWKIIGSVDPNIRQCVFMILHHTSWYDFFLGLFARGISGLDMHFVGKKELFRFPFGAYFRWMGGTPLDRSGGRNKVDAIVEIFRHKPVFRLGIAPEGTRKKVTELKSGFYYIALKAGVPIIPVAFDYSRKQISWGTPMMPTGAYEQDLKILLPHFKHARGKHPQFDFQIPTEDSL